jgi:isopenicillin-N N-acyltransferase-like protein
MQVEQQGTGPAFRYPEGQHGGAWLRYLGGLPVLSVAGDPEEMGGAIGALAVRAAPRMTAYPEDLLNHYCAGWLHGLLVWAGDRMIRRLPMRFGAEFDAIVSASGADRRRMVLGNTLFDLKKILACSALLIEPSRSATGGTLLGRNLDYPSRGYAHDYSLVTVYRPAGRLAFASIGFPGLLGCLSGMNEAGLSLAVLEVFQSRLFTRRLDLDGTPYAVCFRTLLEECDTIEQARRRLEKMRRTSVFNLAIADRRRVAVFENTTRRVLERPAERGMAVCTNHFCSPELRPSFSINVYDTFDRHGLLRKHERGRDRFGVADLHAALHASSQGDHTLQTMVFEPSALRLHLAAGQLPSSAGPLRTLDLAPLFRGEKPAYGLNGQASASGLELAAAGGLRTPT